MVSSLTSKRLDPVAERLAEAGDQGADDVLAWLERQEQRNSMRRRAQWCAAGGWLLMTVAALISCGVTILISGTAAELVGGNEDFYWSSYEFHRPLTFTVAPAAMMLVTLLLIVGGLVGWASEKIPIFSKTTMAIDWSSASDAMTRLLAVGCAYPEAFRTAAMIARSRPSRNWLIAAAQRVERGGEAVVPSPQARGDSAVLELMIDSADGEPHRQWRVAADHYFELAQRRLVLLLQSTPMIATIISGLLIWASISTTLGWLWRTVAEMIQGLN